MSVKRPSASAIVLAAGRGTRFRSALPKVLHPLAGRPLVSHVLGALRGLRLRQVCLIVPPGKSVERALDGQRFPFEVEYAVQKEPRGTGDAARLGLKRLQPSDEVLVLAADMPLIEAATLDGLLKQRRAQDAAAAVLTAFFDRPPPFGRIVRDGHGAIVDIVEASDATAEQLRVREVNTSAYAFRRDALARVLPKLSSANAQGELYLTDAVAALVRSGAPVTSYEATPEEALGTNTRADHAKVAGLLRDRVLAKLMDAGVMVIDPAATYIDGGVTVGADTILRPNTYLEGATKVGAGCDIGPNVRLVDTTVADGATVTFAVARESKIGPDAEVGPFASLRPGTVLRRGAKAGTFVEMKAADIGEGTKVPHLSYMGDVRVGRDANIGAGTITANYDGTNKHRTTVGDGVHTGTDTTLVAPVRVGNRARTGAGSVVTRNVKDGELVYGVPAKPREPSKKSKRPSKRGKA